MKQGTLINKEYLKNAYIEWLKCYAYVQKSIAIHTGCKKYNLTAIESIDIFNIVYADIEF